MACKRIKQVKKIFGGLMYTIYMFVLKLITKFRSLSLQTKAS